MEIKPSENASKIFSLNRFRTILVLLIRIPLPILAALIVIIFILIKIASALKLNKEIYFYPLIFVVGSALLFTPYMFYILIKEKRRSWIILFSIIVVLPCLFVFIISFGNIFTIPAMIVLMVPFYIYFYLLRHTVDVWIEEYEGLELRKEREREKERRLKEEEGWM